MPRLVLRPFQPDDVSGRSIGGRALDLWTGIAVEDDGTESIAGIGGLVETVDILMPSVIMLLDVKRPEFKSPFLYRFAKKMLHRAEENGIQRVVTFADLSIPKSEKLLAALGFVPLPDRLKHDAWFEFEVKSGMRSWGWGVTGC